MTKGLSDAKVKWLTYLVYILITFLVIVTGWQQFMVASLQADQKSLEKSLPDKFVSKERYLTDKHYTESCLIEIQKDIKEILKVLK